MDYVLVTTSHRGVFAGFLKSDEGEVVTLAEARNCLYWSQEVRGFLGLAITGPTKSCRVGPAAPEVKLYGVTSVSQCTDEAQKAWEPAPWS